MKIHLALVLIRMLSWLPLPLLHGLAWPVGRALYFLPWRKHQVIQTNLALAFPQLDQRQRDSLHRRNLVEMVRLVLESGVVWHGSARRLERLVRTVQGWHHVEDARQSGRGVLLIGGHFGNWEIDALYVGRHGRFSGLYKAPRNKRVEPALTGSRTRFGARLIAAGSPAMRQLIRELRSGGTVGLLMDQQPRQGEGVFAPFFGHPALTMTLVNRLAQRTGCRVVFAGGRRLGGGRGWELAFEPVDEAIAGDDPALAAGVMNAVLEARIRQQPEQYLWLYKRFALQPSGRTSPYS